MEIEKEYRQQKHTVDSKHTSRFFFKAIGLKRANKLNQVINSTAQLKFYCVGYKPFVYMELNPKSES